MRKKRSARFESDQCAPRGVGLLRRRDGAVDLLGGREVDLARLLARRRVVDRALAPRVAPDGSPADPVPDQSSAPSSPLRSCLPPATACFRRSLAPLVRRYRGPMHALSDRPLHARPARPRQPGTRTPHAPRASTSCRSSCSTTSVLGRFGAPNRVAFLLERSRGSRPLAPRARRRPRRAAGRRRRGDRSLRARVGRAGRVPRRGRQLVRRTPRAPAARRRARRPRVARASPSSRPAASRPAGGDHFAVFTPYWNRWRAAAAPGGARPASPRCGFPTASIPARIPEREETAAHGRLAGPPARRGERGASAARRPGSPRGLGCYGERRDDLAADGTSRLSPYLHFGCVSPLEVVERAQR